MSISQNDVFKFVNLRHHVGGLTIEPTEDVSDSEAIDRLQQPADGSEPGGEADELRIDPENPSPEVLSRLSGLSVLTEEELGELRLRKVHEVLESENPTTFARLEELRIKIQGERISLREFSTTAEFVESYRQLTDSWLISKLSKTDTPPIDKMENLIRAAHLSLRLQVRPGSLQEPGIIARLRKAQIVFPRTWRVLHYRFQDLDKTYSERLHNTQPPSKSDLRQRISAKKQAFVTLEKKIAIQESIQSKSLRTYWRWKNIVTIARQAKKAETLQAQASSILDAQFFSMLRDRLTQEELDVFEDTFGENPENKWPDFDSVQGELEPSPTIAEANDACAQIRVWEDEEKEDIPLPPDHVPSDDRPAMRALGWGDLVVARESLVDYDANEIAHIENVLSGEEKVREHERTKTTEEFTETETTEETETERDLQTTDRHELQSQSQKTIQQDFSIDAGVNTSGKYGLTQVDTSLDVNFSRGSNESRSSATNVAKEVVSRTVERVFESVRKLRRLTITEQIRELNKHSIRNVAAEGKGQPSSFSGVYMWVEKVHEVELRHYGTRMMFEFHIPEPAVSLLERLQDKPEVKARKPAPLAIGPGAVSEANYLCLTKLYGVQDVEPPPPKFVKVGYSWKTSPDESAENWAESTASEKVNIPENYIPLSGIANLTAPRFRIKRTEGADDVRQVNRVHLYCAIGGQEIFDEAAPHKSTKEFELTSPQTWPQGGIPVSFLARGHWDRALVANVALLCERTPQSLVDWKLRTWEKIREAHQVLIQEYDRAVEEAQFQDSALFEIQTRPAVENRRIEKDELKKWAIKTVRLATYQFNAVRQEGDFQEIDPLNSDMQAPIVNFFEEAFEWRQMSYFLYPYFWGRRDAWKLRQRVFDKADPQHNAFLQAGAAKVIVPVTPGYEERLLHYIESENTVEREKIKSPAQKPDVSYYEDLWLELLLNKNEELAHGLGTLSVEKDNTRVRIGVALDDDDSPRWRVSERDVGRELFIGGDRYLIASVGDDDEFHLNEPYKGETNDRVKYATGSVPYGPPWLVRIPTSLVILSDEKEKIT